MCTIEKPFILACSESRITNAINANEYKIDGYDVIEQKYKSKAYDK